MTSASGLRFSVYLAVTTSALLFFGVDRGAGLASLAGAAVGLELQLKLSRRGGK